MNLAPSGAPSRYLPERLPPASGEYASSDTSAWWQVSARSVSKGTRTRRLYEFWMDTIFGRVAGLASCSCWKRITP